MAWPLATAGYRKRSTRMLRALRAHAAGLVEVAPPEFACGTEGMVFGSLDEAAARAIPGPLAHMQRAAAMDGPAAETGVGWQYCPSYGRLIISR